MKPNSKSVYLAAVLFICVCFSAPRAYAIEPGAEARIAWLSDQIADYLQMTTGDTFGQPFRDMIAGILSEQMAEDAPWYRALDKAFRKCGAAGKDPYNAALQDICEREKLVAIQGGLEVLASGELPPLQGPWLLSLIDEALRDMTGEEKRRRKAPILDPQTSEQEHYYEQGREVSPAQ
jgi:hypothetical protein